MTALPNPFHSGGSQASPDEAAAPDPQMPSAGAAADIPEDDISNIGEIFVGAAKLEPVEIWFENTAYPREDELLYEVLQAIDDPHARDLPAIPDEQAFWEAIEPMPVFLEQMRA